MPIAFPGDFARCGPPRLEEPKQHVSIRRSWVVRGLVIGTALGIGGALSAQGPALRDRTGRELYTAACANCHSGDGRGASTAQVGFADPIPDFTDCSFASREAAQDWFAIVHQGGRVRAFSHRMPAFGEALTDAQIERVVDYVRTLCRDKSWPRGELNLPRAMATEKAFPEDEVIVAFDGVTRKGAREGNAELIYERRFGARNQIELALPFGVREGEGGNISHAQPGDIGIALKRTLAHSGRSGTILSVIGEAAAPTGDPATGMGSGTWIFEPGLLFGQAFPANFFFQAHVGAELSADKEKSGHEMFWRGAFGTTIAPRYGRAWSPIVEVLGAREMGPGVKPEWDMIPQMQISLSRRQHILASVGVQIPMTDRTRPKRLVAYLLWDWFDGGLFDGW
jgi:mono/diheme cytochrome c family protein